ncbi:hypothetical protein ASC73_11805 [Phenylobacterium sp. Root1277]|nr:hypothetical protein ASC73_11805 [Phenylobacterium sp. Root1277]
MADEGVGAQAAHPALVAAEAAARLGPHAQPVGGPPVDEDPGLDRAVDLLEAGQVVVVVARGAPAAGQARGQRPLAEQADADAVVRGAEGDRGGVARGQHHRAGEPGLVVVRAEIVGGVAHAGADAFERPAEQLGGRDLLGGGRRGDGERGGAERHGAAPGEAAGGSE